VESFRSLLSADSRSLARGAQIKNLMIYDVGVDTLGDNGARKLVIGRNFYELFANINQSDYLSRFNV